MSFNSPAKQERIERHLMRQRGAGVRTVSSSFGFAFGPSSALASNDATPTNQLEEPPAKRRKIVLSNEIVAVESTVEKDADVAKYQKTTKPRRKLDLENDDPGQATAAADDSFIAGLGKKRVATAKSKTNKTPLMKTSSIAKSKAKATPATRSEPYVEILEDQPPTTAKSRRRAAATAASKVIEEFEQEAAPVDEKRQIPETSNKRGRPRKKDVVVEQKTGPALTETAIPDDASEAPSKVMSKGRGTGRKRKAKDEDTVTQQIADVIMDEWRDELAANVDLRRREEAVDHIDEGRCSQEPPLRKVPKASKQKQTLVERTRKKTLEAVPCTESSAEFSSAFAGDGDSKDDSRVASSRNTKVTRTQRRPLAETNMNITMRSASPEKLPHAVSNESTFQESKSKQRSKAPVLDRTTLPPTKPEPKRRKLNIKRDAVETTSQCSRSNAEIRSQTGDLSETNDPKQASLDQAEKTVASAVDQRRRHSAGRAAAQRRRNLMREAKEGADDGGVSACKTAKAPVRDDPNVLDNRQGEKVERCVSADARDEDVDWLFAPQPQANFSKPPTAKTKRDSKVKRGNFKMPEMDLDDLLSNVATFAQEKTRPGAVVPQDVRLFACGASKRTRR